MKKLYVQLQVIAQIYTETMDTQEDAQINGLVLQLTALIGMHHLEIFLVQGKTTENR